MAVQPNDKRRKSGYQVTRTPAPDEITNPRAPGKFSPGTNGPQPSSVAPGIASESILGQNLRQSQVADLDPDNDVLSQVIAKGVAGRGDAIPADGDADDVGGQLRSVSSKMYPAAHGMKRLQDPNFFKSKTALPASTTKDEVLP